MTTSPFTLPRHREPLMMELVGNQLTSLHSHIAGVDAGTSRWVIPGWIRTTRGTNVSALDALIYQPILLSTLTTFDRIGIEVTTLGSGSVRLGIYEADISNPAAITPGVLVLDAGTVSVGTTGIKTITISQQLNPGFYFLAIAVGVAVTLRCSVDAAGPMQGNAANSDGPGYTLDETMLGLWRAAVGAGALPDPASTPTYTNSIREQTVALRR